MMAFISTKKYLLGFFLIAIMNVIFFYTYPMNVANFDYVAYLNMMNSHVSNLILASGYPAFFSILLNLLQISSVATVLDIAWLAKIQLIQLAVHLTILSYCFYACIKTFDKLTAIVMCLIWGLSTVFMASVNAGSPEWLHGDLIALSFLLSVQAFTSIENKLKLAYYLLSWLIFSMAYLVKFNSLVLLPILFVILALDKKSFFWKVSVVSLSMTTGLIVVLGFISLFHYPTTKTKHLSYDHAWVLIAAMPNEYLSMPVEQQGINTVRWKALSSQIPADYTLAGAYCCVDTGASKDVREFYKTKYHQIMQFSKSELLNFIKLNPLPSGFINGASAVPLYWYYGLPEIDALGIEVFKESILTIPSAYIKRMADGFKTTSAYKKQMVPFFSNELGTTLGKDEGGQDGFVSFKPPRGLNAYAQPYYNPSEKVWAPGVHGFEVLSRMIMPRWLELFLFAVATLGVVFSRNSKFKFFGVLYLGSILIFSSASFVLLGMRTKEFTSITPILALFYGLGLSSAYAICRDALHLKSTPPHAK